MNHSYLRCITRFIIIGLVLGLSSQAMAEYVWLDDKGVRQYSDMPPPAAIPNSRILKSPGATTRTTTPNNASEPAADPNTGEHAATKATLPMTTTEKNADFQKRRMDQSEKDKKAADEARLAADKSKNCERAGAYQKALDSGQRIVQQDKDGQRAFLSEAQRIRESRDTRKILSECK